MRILLQDLRFALRQILRNLGFSLTAVISLTLGIAATVAVYSILYDAVLHPWPYKGMNRMVQVWTTDQAGHRGIPWLTGPQIRQLRQVHASKEVAAFDTWNMEVTGKGVPDNVQTVMMTGNGFQFLGMPARLGRDFEPSYAPDGQDSQPVAVLGYRFWQSYFRGDRSVIGKTIQLSHKSYTILGVMPPRFTWMDGDVYLPMNTAADSTKRYYPFIKHRQGVSLAEANAEFVPLFRNFNRETPNYFPTHFKSTVRSVAASYVRSLKHTMYLLLAAVALLLAIGCGNVSILLLARGTAREHEFAIRSALGAGRLRIVRQLLTESLLLALTGTGLGVFLAYRVIALVVPILPQYSYPHEADFHINLAVLCFSVGIGLLSGVLFGLVPAWHSSRENINQVMQSGTRRLTGSAKGKGLHTSLIAGQIALTLLLMTAAGAAIQAFVHMLHVPLGYAPAHVMAIQIPLHQNTHKTWADRAQYLSEIREKVAETPGVIEAGISTTTPPPYSGGRIRFDILGKSALSAQQADIELVGPQYFNALRIPLLQGRVWNQAEIAHGAKEVLVNQAFVRQYLSGKDPTGQSLRFPHLAGNPPDILAAPGTNGWLQVIGVVKDSLDDGLEKPVAPAVYAPYTLYMPMWTAILVRARGNPLALLHSIKEQVASVNPSQQVAGNVQSLQAWLEHEPDYARARLIFILFGAFSVLALILAAVGLYSVVSYTVMQRTGELGLRVALGAQRSSVLGIVARSAGTSVGLGIAVGLVLSFALNQLISRWVEQGTHNPSLILAASILLIAIAALACFIPAHRALAIDPMEALRCE